ncbi:MAG: MotA/TolQ/ExbB proton channel family protein [Nitrospinae bacterium]|nr:MotA/TolQ/ExbB proton channel family protein [Nitrospinota bacterium]
MNELTAHIADMFEHGGPVIWVIFAVSLYGMALVGERWLRYRSAEREIAAALGEGGDWSHALVAPLADAGRSRHDGESREELADRVRNAYVEQAAQMELRLGAISVIATLLPMLGILGTVVGMIAAFNAIALHGTGDPKILADGVAQALLTTEAGLITSIPLLYLHQLLVDRADRIVRRLDECAARIVHQTARE